MNLRELLVSALFAVIGTVASATESITVDPVNLPKGGEAELVVRFHFNEGHDYVSYQFTVGLPDGVTLKPDEYGKVPVILGDGQPLALFTPDLRANKGIVTCYSNPSTRIGGTEGVLMRIPILADESVEVGDQLEGSLTAVEFATIAAVATPFANAGVELNIVENRVILDETSTTPPADAEGVNVRVMRTINAGSWSTICLPFAMTEAQCKAAFGDDVQLADFTHCEATYDVNEDVTGLEVQFADVDIAEGMEANHPYIIKVSEAITEFTADDVDIEVEEVPSVDRDEYKVKPKIFIYNSFVGTYVAQTDVPNQCLFLSGNNFWYSSGATKMKAFRAYFDFQDVLSNPEESGARIAISIDDDPTGIVSVRKSEKSDNVYYDLTGRRVEKPGKGFYIVNGKKILKQ